MSSLHQSQTEIAQKTQTTEITYKNVDGDVSTENIFNYAETCMSDDPGWKNVIDLKRFMNPERIMNLSKSNISVIFYGEDNSNIIYKAEHLWTPWLESDLEGAHYNRTKQGWIGEGTFKDWSKHIFFQF